MSGEAITSSFMIGTATVMLGKQADMMNLTHANSVGLVKNVTVKSAPSYAELTQGVTNSIVGSKKTKDKLTVDGEVYEYTSANLAYFSGLDGTSIVATPAKSLLATAIAAPIAPAVSAAALSVTTGDGLLFSVGDNIMVQVGLSDQCFLRSVKSIASDVLTVDAGFPCALPLSTKIQKVNILALGTDKDAPYFSAKIVGILADGSTSMIMYPKVRVTSGINMAFKSEAFEHMALQLEIFDTIPADPFYSMMQTAGPGGTPAKGLLISST